MSVSRIVPYANTADHDGELAELLNATGTSWSDPQYAFGACECPARINGIHGNVALCAERIVLGALAAGIGDCYRRERAPQ